MKTKFQYFYILITKVSLTIIFWEKSENCYSIQYRIEFFHLKFSNKFEKFSTISRLDTNELSIRNNSSMKISKKYKIIILSLKSSFLRKWNIYGQQIVWIFEKLSSIMIYQNHYFNLFFHVESVFTYRKENHLESKWNWLSSEVRVININEKIQKTISMIFLNF